MTGYFPNASRETPLGRPSKYDWDGWIAAGDWVTLTEGEDFDCTAESMGVLIRRTARTRGLDVAVHRLGTGRIKFKFQELGEGESGLGVQAV